MAKIDSLITGYYRIPLPEVLTDSIHGVMRDFELVTARIRDGDGSCCGAIGAPRTGEQD